MFGSGYVSERFECGRTITCFNIRQMHLPFLPYFELWLHTIVIIYRKMHKPLPKIRLQVIFLSYICVSLQGYCV